MRKLRSPRRVREPSRPPAPGCHPCTLQITYGSTRTVPQLWCRVCGERPPVKSNLAIAEERSRFLKALDPPAPVTCPNSACASHGRPVTGPTIFWAFGRTRSGSPRYRCKICKRTVAIGTATTGQKAPHKNREIFSLLMIAQIEGSAKNPPIRTPSIPMLEKIAKALNVKVGKLLE